MPRRPTSSCFPCAPAIEAVARLAATLLALVAVLFAPAALAAVTVHFQSFNGSVLVGRYPHTFVVLDGTLDATGEAISENYGFTARRVTPAILSGPVDHMIDHESEKYVRSTNRHFSVTVDDAIYWRIRAEVEAWRELPGKGYDLQTRNCIHFVGAIAELVGLSVDYPQDMLRRPRKWLNHLAALNPALGAEPI